MLGPEYREIKNTTQLAERTGFIRSAGEPKTSRDRIFLKDFEHEGQTYQALLEFLGTQGGGKWINLGVSLGSEAWTKEEHLEKIPAQRGFWNFPEKSTQWGFPNEYLESGGYEEIAKFLESDDAKAYLHQQTERLLSEREFGRGLIQALVATGQVMFPEFENVQDSYDTTKELFLFTTRQVRGRVEALRFRLNKNVQGIYRLNTDYATAKLKEVGESGGGRLDEESFERSRRFHHIWDSVEFAERKEGDKRKGLETLDFGFEEGKYSGFSLDLTVTYYKIEDFFRSKGIKYK